jgi:small-conductance mechanosensitive channel
VRVDWRVRAILLAGVVLALPIRGPAAELPPEPMSKPVVSKKVEIHRLTSEELFKQADAIYAKASRDYLAQLRALATAEVLLAEVRTTTDGGKTAPPSPTGPEVDKAAKVGKPARLSSEDSAKKALDAAKAKQGVAGRKLKLARAEKELLDRIATAIEACLSAGAAFQNALEDLRAYTLETGLRVKDGSLAEDKVPRELKPDFSEKKKAALLHDLAGLKAKVAGVHKEQEAVAGRLAEASKAVLAADADVVESSKNLVREQKRQELEKTYAGKKPEEMIPELGKMVDDGIALKGAYELGLRKLEARVRESARLRGNLEALKPPDAKVPRLTRAEDVAAAANSIQKLIAFYTARTKKIEELRAAVAGLAQAGADFEADAVVSEEHLFKMVVLAGLLRKQGVPEEKLPVQARAAALVPAADRQKKSAATVRAATGKAKVDGVILDRQLGEATAAREAAAKQLANLKESQEVTLAALKWEGRLKGMSGREIVAAFAETRKQLAGAQRKLKEDENAYKQPVAAVAEAKARLDAIKDPFLRTAEEQGQAEKQKLIAELRKEAGLDRTLRPEASASLAGGPKKAGLAKDPEPGSRSELEKIASQLAAFQQLLAGRVRVLDEQEVKKKELLARLDELEKKAAVYAKTIANARLLALQLNAIAVELKKRLGKGDLGDLGDQGDQAGDAFPEGVTEALRLEMRTKLDAAATSVLNARNLLQQDRDQLLHPDPDAEALATATRELLTIVGKRLDLLVDLKRLTAEYLREKSARPSSEVKRQEQRATDRLNDESSGWDALLGVVASKTAKSLSELLEAYYREVIEIEDKEENLNKQKEKVDQLVELTRRETSALARVLPLLASQVARLEARREEETVLAHARLRPDRAEELLRAYQTKTGRLLAKPVPLPDADRAEKVEDLGNLIFECYVRAEAARKWSEVLGARVAPAGIKAEAGAYQDEMARLNAASAANARRVQVLTGRDTPGPATGGEICTAREELARARTHGLKGIALKIGGIILAALLLPRLLLWILRLAFGRARREDSSLAFSALRAVLKAVVWVTALSMILSTLGFNLTAILAGLGIGGLAIGLAAQPMIADVIGAVVIFVERRFKIGDVIRLGNDDPAQVVGLTWRATQVKTSDGLAMTIPNRKVTEALLQNLTKTGGTYDSLNVTVTTQKDEAGVLAALEGALTECTHLAADRGVSVREYNQKGETKTIKYRFWWFLLDYETRNKTRAEVFARLSARLAHEDLGGTEIGLA